MITIKAVVRNGRIETETPLDLPDGTELTIAVPDLAAEPIGIWDDTPESLAAWEQWYASLEPLTFTEDERAAYEANKQARRDWELAHWEEYTEKLKRMWE